MNRKQFILLLVLVAVIGGIGLFLSNRKARTWQTGDQAATQKAFPDFPINDVAQITIKHDTNELHLAKADDVWKVKERHDYPANFSEISEFLRKIWELKPVQEVRVGPSQFGRLELTTSSGTNSATVVEFKDKGGKSINSVLLGKKHMRESQGGSQFGGGGEWPVGRYLTVPGQNPQKVWLTSETFSNIEPKPEDWVNKDFFKVEKVKAISVVSPVPTNSWKLHRETETGDWVLGDKKEGEDLDKNKLYSMNNALSSPSFNDVAPQDQTPAATNGVQTTVATLETFDNFVYTVNVSGKTNDENYALSLNVDANIQAERTPGKDEKPEDKEKLDKEFKEKAEKLKEKLEKEKAYAKWSYQVSKWTVDPLLKNRHELMAEKKAEPAAADATKDPAKTDLPPLPVTEPDKEKEKDITEEDGTK